MRFTENNDWLCECFKKICVVRRIIALSYLSVSNKGKQHNYYNPLTLITSLKDKSNESSTVQYILGLISTSLYKLLVVIQFKIIKTTQGQEWKVDLIYSDEI